MRISLFKLSSLLLLLHAGDVMAQISGPTAAVAGAAVTFTGPAHKESYTWSLEPQKLTMPAANSLVRTNINNTASTGQVVTLNDNGTWYTFTMTENTKQLLRMNMGTNPTATGITAQVALSGFMPNNNPQFGFDITKDSVSGEWFGYCIQNGSTNAIRLDFGTSLGNAPTATPIAVVNMPAGDYANVNIVRDENEYMMFIANRSTGKPIRVDIGHSLKSSQLNAVELPIQATGVVWNTSMSVYKHKDKWYGFTVLTQYGRLYRYDFGATLKNNNPTAVEVGSNIVGQTNNWNLRILPYDCGDGLSIFMMSSNNFRIFEFPGGDPTAVPTTNGNLITQNFTSTLNFGISPFVYDKKIYVTLSSLQGGGIYYVKVADLPASTEYQSYNENTLTHTFSTPGTYTISLLTNVDGGSGAESHCHTITITAPSSGLPQPDPFTAAPASVCRQQNNVTYTIPAVTGAATYVWHYTGTGATYTASTSGPGNTLSFDNTATSGTLSVWGVNSSGDSSIASRDVNITVNVIPSVTINPATAAVCAGDAITLTAGGATTYSWSNGGGSNAAATFSPVATTTYSVTGTTLGCSATVSRQVTVHNLPNVNISPASASVCAGESVTLTAGGATSYSWSHSGGTNTSATFTPTATTSYIVTGTDANDCKKADTADVSYHQLPVVQVTIPGSITDVCVGDSVTLVASGTGYNYTWKDDASQAVGHNQTYKAYSTGTYTVVASDAVTGCSDSATSAGIRVLSRPSVALDQDDTSFCLGGVVKLEVMTPDTGLTYAWKKDNVANPSATAYFLEVNEEGAYKVIVGRQGIQSCEDSTNEVSIVVHPLPVVTATWDGERLTATSGFASYQWHVSGQAVPGAQDSIFIPTSDGGYTVAVVDNNGCEHTSDVVQADKVGINSSDISPLRVYPNPTTGIVRIEATGMVDVQVAGMDGRLIREYTQVQSIDISNYASGVYLLRIADREAGRFVHVRLVKE